MQSEFSIKARLRSFGFAFEGISAFFRTQHNALVHACATVVVIPFAAYYNISAAKWMALLIAIALVWMAELLNTAIEKVCDLVSPQKSAEVKFIKDVAAAAVLVASILAFLIGLLIFIPQIL
jgi:diacylglycerol kinase (ATP)